MLPLQGAEVQPLVREQRSCKLCDVARFFLIKMFLEYLLVKNIKVVARIFKCTHVVLGLPWWLRRSRIHLQCRRRFSPWVRKVPWSKE